jgi:methionyl-tRNA synthetase
VVTEANRFVSATRPWELARAARSGDPEAAGRLEAALETLLEACRLLAHELQPFLPAAAGRIEAALAGLDPARGRTLFPKFEQAAADRASRRPRTLR